MFWKGQFRKIRLTKTKLIWFFGQHTHNKLYPQIDSFNQSRLYTFLQTTQR